MKSLKYLVHKNLLWKQPKFLVDHFQLFAGDDFLAELYWTKWFSDRAFAHCPQGNWYFDRVGFFRRRVVAMEADSGDEIVRWYRTGAWGDTWVMADKDGDTLFVIRFGTHWFRHQAYVTLRKSAKEIADLALLLCFAMYLGFCNIQDIAGAVAATTATTAAM
jgi:hypothetical protein